MFANHCFLHIRVYGENNDTENIITEKISGHTFKRVGDFIKLPMHICLIKTEEYIILKYGFVYGMDSVEDQFQINGSRKVTFVNRKLVNPF